MPFKPDYFVPESRRAYSFPSGNVGVLMMHGFLGSPTSSRPMAAYLAERGITVHCPLLPGHGGLPSALYKIDRQAWIDEAEEALDIISRRCDEVFLIGHSMGNVLNAHLACENPNVRGLIMLAPAYQVPDRRMHALRVLRYVMPWFYPLWSKRLTGLVHERLLDYDPDLDLDDPGVQAKLPEMSKVPTGAMDEMRKMLDLGRHLWPKLVQPVIVFQGMRDIAVDARTTQKLFDSLPAKDKEIHYFERAGHELMRPFEPVHAQVWPKVVEFIKLHSALFRQQVSAPSS